MQEYTANCKNIYTPECKITLGYIATQISLHVCWFMDVLQSTMTNNLINKIYLFYTLWKGATNNYLSNRVMA